VSERSDQASQEIERIMRRAAQLGFDPQRVAVALDYHEKPTTFQRVEQVRPCSWYQRLFAWSRRGNVSARSR
jgi:hypothetical protein